KGDIVIFAAAGDRLDLLDMFRRQIRAQRDDHISVLEREDQPFTRRRRGLRQAGGNAEGDGQSGGGKGADHGASVKLHEYTPARAQEENLSRRAVATGAGTKGRTSPPIAAICLTNVAVMVRTGGLAGRKIVCSSGAMVAFMPAICIS